MFSSLRKCHLFTIEGMKAGAAIASASAVLAGCSADISRFDLGYSEGARAHSSGSSYGTTGRTASADYGSAGYDRPSSTSSVSRTDLAPMTTAAIHEPQQGGSYGGGYGSQGTYGQQGSGYGSQQGGYGQDNGYRAAPSYGSSAPQARSYDNSYNSGASSRGSAYGSAGAYGGNAGAPAAAQRAPDPAPQYQMAARTPPSSDMTVSGDTIEVQQGDTLYSLSRRHGVSVNALMAENGLNSNSLRPGQQLRLPSATSRPPAATVPAAPPRENYEVVAVRPAQAVDAPSNWTRSYTVRPGDSLYAIARQSGVKLSELERYNGISDSRTVKPGTQLKLPASGSDVAEADRAPSTEIAEAGPEETTVAEAPSTTQTPEPTPGVVSLGSQPSAPPAQSTARQPTLLNGTGTAGPAPERERVARVETNTATDAVSPSSTSNSTAVAGFSKLRWPVAGKIISGFGPRPDGTHNDGVNLATPMGTDIHAAEGGVVAYAGDELKGYGNLVLLRHDNGWVTAYAHADEILVKRGDRIKRGQVIAKAGRTGQVEQPQVHFELRQGQKPVDPTPFMERL